MTHCYVVAIDDSGEKKRSVLYHLFLYVWHMMTPVRGKGVDSAIVCVGGRSK